jgi:hypothetical protein
MLCLGPKHTFSSCFYGLVEPYIRVIGFKMRFHFVRHALIEGGSTDRGKQATSNKQQATSNQKQSTIGLSVQSAGGGIWVERGSKRD